MTNNQPVCYNMRMNAEDIDNMQAGRELDALILKGIFGLEPQECMVGGHPRGCPGSTTITSYSTDIAAAWQVVEKLMNELQLAFYLDSRGDKLWDCSFTRDSLDITPGCLGVDTAPLAICRAALMAVSQVPQLMEWLNAKGEATRRAMQRSPQEEEK